MFSFYSVDKRKLLKPMVFKNHSSQECLLLFIPDVRELRTAFPHTFFCQVQEKYTLKTNFPQTPHSDEGGRVWPMSNSFKNWGKRIKVHQPNPRHKYVSFGPHLILNVGNLHIKIWIWCSSWKFIRSHYAILPDNV